MWDLAVRIVCRSDAANPVIQRWISGVKGPVIMTARLGSQCQVGEGFADSVVGQEEVFVPVGRYDALNGVKRQRGVEDEEIGEVLNRGGKDGGKGEEIKDLPENGDVRRLTGNMGRAIRLDTVVMVFVVYLVPTGIVTET